MNAAPPKTCFPSLSYSSLNSRKYPAARHAVRTRARAGKIRSIRLAGRENTQYPSRVKMEKTEFFLSQITQDDAADEKSGNDEEHVDADKTAPQYLWKRMKNNHDDHGKGPQTINVGAVGMRRGVLLLRRNAGA